MIYVNEKALCCGCSACSEICPLGCISMESDSEGFLYPHVDEQRCINCDKCVKTCPIITRKEERYNANQKAYVVQNLNRQVLQQSTSGGGFSAIADYIIADGGIVFGAAFDDRLMVHHMYVDNPEGLRFFRNSKYVQSNVERTYTQAKSFLDMGKRVLYSGTPCQIEGINNFLGKPYDNLVLVDVVCRAVPSPLFWGKYISHVEHIHNKKVSEVQFRNKDKYGYEYSQMKITFSDDTTSYSGVESNPYLRAFFSNICDRPSCYDCRFKKRYRVSDLTLWDCFDAEKFDKSLDDNRGATRVLVHSEKGLNIIRNLNNCKVTAVRADDLTEGVNELIKSVSCHNDRNEFFLDLIDMGMTDFLKKYFPDTLKIKAERFARISCEKMRIYRKTKKLYFIMRNILSKPVVKK